MSFSYRCKQCAKSFTRSLRPTRGLRIQFCGRACHYEWKSRPRELRPDAVQLAGGTWCLVSPEDMELARSYRWSGRYAHSRTASWKVYSTGLMHRIIMMQILGRTLDAAEHVDHINRNALDNRRSNLRVVTNVENAYNIGLVSTNKSGYMGVCWRKSGARWVAKVGTIHVGLFNDKEEAAWMRDQYVMELIGDVATLNFEYI